MAQTIVISDTSVLINSLVLDQVHLLGCLPAHKFVVTEHVRAEIKSHYVAQLRRLEATLASGILEEIRVTDLDEVRLFAELTTTGLGVGECSAIAVAMKRQFVLASDDKRAIKKVAARGYRLATLGTEDLIVLLIQECAITVEQADRMKLTWERQHRFKLPFKSFSERI